MGMYYESWKAGAVIPIDELLKIAAGPGLNKNKEEIKKAYGNMGGQIHDHYFSIPAVL